MPLINTTMDLSWLDQDPALTFKGWVTIHGHHVLIGSAGGKGSGGGGGSRTGTDAEGKAFASKGAFTSPIFHYTQEKHAESIDKEGFRVQDGGTQYYGKGVYFGTKGSAFYGPTKITAYTNIKNPYVYHNEDRPLGHSKSPLGPEIDKLREKDPSLLRAAAVTHILQKRGYDGVDGMEDGERIVIVFDPSNIMIVK